MPTTSRWPVGRVFTYEDALQFGLTRSAVGHAVSAGRIVRIRRGAYVDAAIWSGQGFAADGARARLAAEAAVRLVGPAAASHTSSALLADLPVWRIPDRPCLTVRPRYSGDSICAHLHRATVRAGDLVGRSAVPRLSTSRTVLDIAREHGLDDAVVVGDAALRQRMTDVDRLVRCARCCAGWPGIRRARHLLSLLDERSESPLESVSRLRLAFTSIPPPDLQSDIVSREGVFLGRVDFYWDEFGVAGEVDGAVKYTDDLRKALDREKWRQQPMEENGLIFVRWGRRDIENMPLLEARLRTQFRRGARRPRSDRGWIARPLPRLYTPIL